MSDNYDDILSLPHPTSKTHPRMSRQDRAAQFSPFAALTGYEAVVKETARLTDERPILTEDEIAALDAKLRLTMELDTEVTVTWFRPDNKKSGGSYLSSTGRIRKMDELQRILTLEDGTRIPIHEITAVSSAAFNYTD
ncbi:MAG: YolD-like family protein [Oscillospiraceae bacterium]|jgi:hypothetical protein|nr:YolD-like family protein [Oscillospiraceae bacterium]